MAFDFNKGTVIQTGTAVTPVEKDSPPPITKKEKNTQESHSWFEKYILTPLDIAGKGFQGAANLSGIQAGVDFTGKAGGRIGESIAYATDPLVREMSQGEAGKDILPFTGDLLDKSTSDVAKNIGGESLSVAAKLAPWKLAGMTGRTLLKAGKYGLAGATIGGGKELSEQLQGDEDIDIAKVSKEAIKDGLTSATLSVVFDKAHSIWQNRATKAYGKAFKPSTKNLQSDIERGKDTINTRMSKEGYSGNAEKILEKAKTNRKKYYDETQKLLGKSDKVVNKKDVIKDVEKIFDENDVLDEWELKLIVKQIEKIPKEMSLAEANSLKTQFAGKVSDSAWDVTASKADSFRNKMYKSIATGFRREVNNKYGSDIIKSLNEKWAIATDVLGLASYNIAQGQGARGLASELAQHPSFYTLLSTPFRPFTTTVARTTRGQLYQNLATLSKDDLTQRLMRFITLEGIQ